MALAHGAQEPLGVRDGLVLYLDAANGRSYPRSGTTWFDRSGNGNNGSLENGVGYSGDNFGSLVFDGVNDYVATGFTRGTLGNYFTLSVWYKYTGTSDGTYSAVIGSLGSDTGFFIGKNTGNTDIAVRDGNSINSFVTGSDAFDGNLHQIVYSYSNGLGRLYLDGLLQNTSFFTNLNRDEQIIIGGGDGYNFTGNISFVTCYDRVFTSSQIASNYVTISPRFSRPTISIPPLSFPGLPENTVDTTISKPNTANYLGGTLAPNGKIYCAPRASNAPVLVVDTLTNTTSTISIPLSSVTGAFSGGAVGVDGRVYIMPFNSTYGLVIDPSNDTIDTSIISGISGSFKWAGCVPAQNGKIYGIPRDETRVMVIDVPNNSSISYINISSASNVTQKWLSGTLAPNGKIYCTPRDATNVLVIDTNDDSFYTIGSLPSGGQKYSGAALAPNGKIYMMPFGSTTSDVLIVDSETDTLDTTSIVVSGTPVEYVGAALAPNGKIYGFPSTSTQVLIIDPETNTIDITSITGLTGTFKWAGGCLGPDGIVYGVPWNASSVLRIRTGIPKMQPWMLEYPFNLNLRQGY